MHISYSSGEIVRAAESTVSRKWIYSAQGGERDTIGQGRGKEEGREREERTAETK
jgi:hypothetical protein